MKTSFPAAVILHGEFGPVPPAGEIEVAPALRIDSKGVSVIEQPERRLVAVGVQVRAINIAAEVQKLRFSLRGTQPARAAQAARRALAVQAQPRHASEVRIKINVQRIRVTGFGSQRPDPLPESRSPAPADMKSPGGQKSGHKQDNDDPKYKGAETTQS